ncbi:MAG: hypothetical protein R2851_09380 [Caldilineaceae bacterium]
MLGAKPQTSAAGMASETPRMSMSLRPLRSPKAPNQSTEQARPSE